MTASSAAAVPSRTVPGWALRAALAAAGLAATGAVMVPAPAFDSSALVTVLLVAASAGAALAPGSVLPLLVMLGAIAVRAATPGPALDAGLAVLVVLLPLIHQLAGVCAPIPPRSACRWRALRPAAVRYAIAVMPVACAVAIGHLVMM